MPSWMYFVLALAGLLAGYCVYGAIVEKVFGPDPNRPTPACKMPDGVDYVEMSPTKVFLIQLLNIAGLGPVFGPILGALYGPIALLWVVIGCVFAGAVHDYFSGMLSVRYNGKSVPDIVGYNLGDLIKKLMRVFAVVLLILVGVVFVAGPAGLLSQLTGMHSMLFVAIIFAYYFLATILPVDKIIGRIYPVFGCALLFMALGILAVLLFSGKYTIPEFTSLENCIADPERFPILPMLFTTIACGAISGFHATQSPLMARCLRSERQARPVFYGAMISESIIALIWAAIAMAFWNGASGLNAAIAEYGGQAAVMVDVIARTTLGEVLAGLVIFGVVACAITSGDTAFRSARLIVADFMGLEQRSLRKRIYISIPLFAAGLVIIFCLPFEAMWSYFAWMNQTLAMVTLWMITAYLNKRGRNRCVGLLPALVMTYVCMS